MQKSDAFKIFESVISVIPERKAGKAVSACFSGKERESKSHEFLSAISLLGYQPQANSKHNDDEIIVEVSLKAQHWNKERFIFKDLGEFLDFINARENKPEFFYILSKDISSSNEKLKEKIDSVFLCKSIVRRIADHEINARSYLIFMHEEKGGRKYDLNLDLNYASLEELVGDFLAVSTASMKAIKTNLAIKDDHTEERVEVFKSALCSFLDSGKNDNIVALFLNKAESICQLYHEQYSIYRNKFSIDKLVNELDQKSLEYTSKINEFVSASQSKALAIPGALLAVGALLKSESFISVALITTALLIAKAIVKMANDIHRKSLLKLKSNIRDSLITYRDKKEILLVQEKANKTKSELDELIDEGLVRLYSLDFYCNVVLIVSIFFLFISFFGWT